MAEVSPTRLSTPYDGHVVVYKWTGATESDTFTAAVLSTHADRSVQVVGTFGGSTVELHGTNDPDGTNYQATHDAARNSIQFTSAGHSEVLPALYQYRPSISGGAGVSVDIYLYANRGAG